MLPKLPKTILRRKSEAVYIQGGVTKLGHGPMVADWGISAYLVFLHVEHLLTIVKISAEQGLGYIYKPSRARSLFLIIYGISLVFNNHLHSSWHCVHHFVEYVLVDPHPNVLSFLKQTIRCCGGFELPLSSQS